MTHRYDWSKLDAGWNYEELDGLRMLFFTESMASRYSYLVERLESDGLSLPAPDEKWNGYRVTALAQLAKCRIRDTEPAPPVDNAPLFGAMDRMSAEIPAEEWAKVPPYPNGLRCKSCGADRPHDCPGPGGARPDAPTVEGQASIERELDTLNSQFTTNPSRIGLAIDMGTGGYGSMIAAYGAPPPPKDWFDLGQPVFVPNDIFDRMPAWPQGEVIATLSNKPPWRRGPLASWTLVNISCHDGRLTVVMKRGRGELVMETGPDDEALWERLGKKVVEFEKAKAAKEKSDV